MKSRVIIYGVIIAIHLIVISLFIFTGDEELSDQQPSDMPTSENTVEIPDSAIVPKSDDDSDKSPEQLRDELLDSLTSDDNDQQTYVVQSGDNLMLISKKFYGTSKYYKYIYEANKNILKSPSSVRSGQTLTIPPAP